ncbi:ras-related and estrogen-regulated growth inhibitor-like isoform X1 [Limulus polyphemus]|uniref:small monomeric GTPase n=1 Tax=Limulus polyphemus TaxID=6850 RepID=A0ABM1BQA1_LIMPO|nr:ras-related and estrogen-regulated growth inhibitor-like isoform X1 [Limulus polyphemus]
MSRIGRHAVGSSPACQDSSVAREASSSNGFVKDFFRVVNNGHLGPHQKMTKPADSRLVLLGNPGVGKSALIVRFITSRFIWEYDPTLECTYRHTVMVDDENVTMEILDTAGRGENILQDGNINWGEGFLLVYSTTDRGSFEDILHLHQHIASVKKTQNFSCVLVGNKNDLTHERKVEQEEAEQLAVELSCCFFECSACDGGDAVGEAFKELHRDVVRRRMVNSMRRRRSSAQQMKQVLNKMFTKINS